MPFSYVEFEDRFRGAFDDVREEQRKYLRFFEDVPGPVVDLGCGRGELLSLLREAGRDAYGVDTSADMRAACAGRGLDAREGDAVGWLESLPDATLGGIFMSHVIEHLPPPQVLRVVELASRRLAPGGAMVIETLNPQCLFAYSPFFMDLTHVWPIHPLTLQYVLEANGFQWVETLHRQYLPEDMLRLPTTTDESALAHAFNEAMGKLQLVLDLSFKDFIYGMASVIPLLGGTSGRSNGATS